MLKRNKKIDFNTEDLESLSNSDLKRIADYWLRVYLLKGQGDWIKCPIKNKKYPLKLMQVAHYIDRINMWTRYDLQNCHLVSSQSNMWDAQVYKEGYKSLHHYDYEKFLILKYKENIITSLKERAENKDIFSKENYIEIINKFRNE